MSADPPGERAVAARYLELLKQALTFSLWPEPHRPLEHFNEDRPLLKRAAVSFVSGALKRAGYQLVRDAAPSWEERRDGRIWPHAADTMMGLTRLTHLQQCVETVLADRIRGDLIEAGVWRGGGCILMRRVLAAYGVTDRRVYVADSFRGFPPAEVKQEYGSDAAASRFQRRRCARTFGAMDYSTTKSCS